MLTVKHYVKGSANPRLPLTQRCHLRFKLQRTGRNRIRNIFEISGLSSTCVLQSSQPVSCRYLIISPCIVTSRKPVSQFSGCIILFHQAPFWGQDCLASKERLIFSIVILDINQSFYQSIFSLFNLFISQSIHYSIYSLFILFIIQCMYY